MIRVEVNDTTVRALLTRARDAAANPEPVLRAAGTTLLSLILGNFSTHGAGFRPASWPPKADGSPATLKKSGTLSSSFHLAVTPTAATISNPMPYAAIHQFGGRTAPRVIEPRRARALHWISGGRDHFARRVNHPGSNIPARPFIPITPAGDLTPPPPPWFGPPPNARSSARCDSGRRLAGHRAGRAARRKLPGRQDTTLYGRQDVCRHTSPARLCRRQH